MNKTEQNNKLIAEFMGWVLQNDPKERFFRMYKSTIGVWHKETDLSFHSDWNWLMEVVEKIENLHHTNTIVIGRNTCFIKHYDKYKNESETIISKSQFANVELTKIEAVYNAVVAFIEWYNQQK